MGAIKATVSVIAESQRSELTHPIDFLKETGVLDMTTQDNYYLAVGFICRMCAGQDSAGNSTISNDWRVVAAKAIYTTPKVITAGQLPKRTLLREARRSDLNLRDVLLRMREVHPGYIEYFVNEMYHEEGGAKSLTAWFMLPEPTDGTTITGDIPVAQIGILTVPPTEWKTHDEFHEGSKWIVNELIHNFVSSDEIRPIKATLASPFYLFLLSFVKRGGSLERIGGKLARRMPELIVIFQEITANHSLSRECYARVGNLVTDDDVTQIFSSIARDANHGAMPIDVINIVKWARNSMMTGTMLAITAFRDYPDFDWAKISEIFPTEARRLVTASETMVQDPFIGFKKERHGVSQRLYRNFIYVAFHLHASLGDQPDLRYLKGIPEAPAKHPEFVKQMIKDYIDRKDTALAGRPDDVTLNFSEGMVNRMKEIMTIVDGGQQVVDVPDSSNTVEDI